MTIGRSPFATSSLGAVGGARGTAAGALRIIMEFITQYDPKAIAAARADLKKIEAEGIALNKRAASRQKSATTLATRLASTEAIVAAKFSKEQRAEFRQIQRLRDTLNDRDLRNARARNKILVGSLDRSKFSAEQIKQVERYGADLARQRRLDQEIVGLKADQTKHVKAQTVAQHNLSRLQAVKSSVVPRLAGLATGALGGIVGGALFGVGFEIAEKALDEVGERLQDLIDPGRHARTIMLEIGEAINSISKAEGLTTLRAISEYLKGIGLEGNQGAISVLQESAQQQGITAALEERLRIQQALEHSTALEEKNRETVRGILEKQGQLQKVQPIDPQSLNFQNDLVKNIVANLSNEAKITQYLVQLGGQLTAVTNARAAAAALAARNAAIEARAQQQAAAYRSVVEGARLGALEGAFGGIIGGLQDQAAAISSGGGGGGNAKADAIQARIQAEQEAQADKKYAQSLRENAEERELIILRKRFRILGETIDLERYQGKFLLAAIDGRIEALNKEGRAADRRNKLLDLQRDQKNADKLKREEGETIQDFIERRAEANQQILRDRDEMAREDKITTLQNLRDRTQDEIDLTQNAEDKKRLIEERAAELRMRALQDELAAAQSAVAGGVDARKKKIEEEIKEWERKRDLVLRYSSQEYLGTLTNAIAHADTIKRLAALNGEIQGLTQARSYIQALVKGGILTQQEANAKLSQIDSALAAYGRQKAVVIPDFSDINSANNVPRRKGNAKGGVFPLNNGSTVFGQNIQAGEEGTELGIILSNQVVRALRDSQGGDGVNIEQLTINRSPNPRRDMYDTRRALQEALR